MVKITKKITAIVLAGILMAGSVGGTPTLVEAKTTKTSSTKVNWSKKYPKLKNPKKKDIKKVAYSKETNAKINRIIKKLDQLEKKFSMKVLNQIWAGICDIIQNQPQDDVVAHRENNQFDYILYKAIYYSFIYTEGEKRDALFVKICDNLYLSGVKRLNSGNYSTLLRDFGGYFAYDVGEYFNDEKMKFMFMNFFTMTLALSDVKIYPPDDWAGDYDDYNYKVDETILPSNVKGDESYLEDVIFKPEYNIGLSFEKYCKEAVKLGFKKTNDIQDPSGAVQEAYGYEINGVVVGIISILQDTRGKSLTIHIPYRHFTSSAYKKWKTTLQKSFDLLLPTQGKELFDMVSQKDIKTKFGEKAQTYIMDGRKIVIMYTEIKHPATGKKEGSINVQFR